MNIKKEVLKGSQDPELHFLDKSIFKRSHFKCWNDSFDLTYKYWYYDSIINKIMSMEYFVEDIIPFVACICCVVSLNASFPGCIGCSGKQEFLCFHCNYFGCRVPEEDDRIWCHGSECYFFCAPIKRIYKNDSQLFCFDILCAFPLSKEIPCMITCCFCTMFYKNRLGPCYIYSTIKKLEESLQSCDVAERNNVTRSIDSGETSSNTIQATAAADIPTITIIATRNSSTSESTPVHPVLKSSSLDSDNDSEYYP